jgi:hypothetical protein
MSMSPIASIWQRGSKHDQPAPELIRGRRATAARPRYNLPLAPHRIATLKGDPCDQQ